MISQQHNEDQIEPAAYTANQVQSQTSEESSVNVVKDCAEGSIDRAISQIKDLSSAVQRRKRAGSWWPVPAIALTAAPIAARILMLNSLTDTTALYWALMATFGVGTASLFALLFTGILDLKRAVNALSGTDDVRAVGVMAESLSIGEPALSVAGSVLIRLLPQMQRKDFEMLSPTQRAALRKGLRCASTRWKYTHFNPSLAIAILQTLQRNGDKLDLAVVEGLASGRAVSAEQRSIRAAAKNCLTVMSARISGEADRLITQSDAILTPAPAGTLSPDAVESLSTRLRKLARIRRRNVTVTAAGSLVGSSLAFLSMTKLSESHQMGNALMAGMLTCLASMIFFALSGTYEQRNLTNALIHSNDLRIVPPLIQAAATVEISGTAAVMLLTRLLPRLRASDANLLDADDRTLLHTAIAKHAHSTAFVLAALAALQQIGDSASIPTVQRLAEQKGRRVADPAIRERARECLEFLRHRTALNEANQTLLRSSSAAAAPTDTLLRAVDASAPIASAELLRTTAAPIVYDQSEKDDANQSVQAFVLQPAG